MLWTRAPFLLVNFFIYLIRGLELGGFFRYSKWACHNVVNSDRDSFNNKAMLLSSEKELRWGVAQARNRYSEIVPSD